MGIRVRLCSDWCLGEADGESDYPQTSVSCIVRTQYPYFAQRYAGITGFGPVVGSVSILLYYGFGATILAITRLGRQTMSSPFKETFPWCTHTLSGQEASLTHAVPS